MRLLWAAVLALGPVGALAGDLVRVDFVAQSRVQLSPAVSAWSPALGSLFTAGLPSSRWSQALTGLSRLDWNDPRHSAAFEPFVQELAKSGLTPQQFAQVSAHQRAQAAQAAFAAAAQSVNGGVHAAADRAFAALEAGPERALEAAVAMLQAEAKAGLYLDAPTAARVGSVHRAALAKQTEARAKKALARLREDVDALRAEDPLEAALARDPRGDGEPTARRGQLLRFGGKKAPKETPQIALKPGQNPAAVLRGLMLGLSIEDASKLGMNGERRDDFFSRYPAAFAAAQEKAALVGYKGGQVYFGEARMPVGGKNEHWSFDFYALEKKDARGGHVVRVIFPVKNGRPELTALTAEFAAVPEGMRPILLSNYGLGRGLKFTPADALRRVGEAAPDAEVGLSVIVRPIPEPVSFDTDLWYVIARGEQEYGRVNGQTGALRLPPAPAPVGVEKPRTFWGGVRAWWASLFT